MLRQVPFLLVGWLALAPAMADTSADVIERGRYLVEIAGCNDCHSPGYAESNGQLPETAWLQGSPVGYSGPWGVSYAANLRLAVENMPLEAWQLRIEAGGLPPMPWPAMRAMSTEDRAAIYHYVKALGPAGDWAPAAQPPGEPIRTLHIPFVPQNQDTAVVKAGG